MFPVSRCPGVGLTRVSSAFIGSAFCFCWRKSSRRRTGGGVASGRRAGGGVSLGGGGVSGFSNSTIVPLQRARRTPLWSAAANQRPPSVPRPRPPAYIKAAAVGSVGHWHNIKRSIHRAADLLYSTFLFSRPLFYPPETMADTQVDSGSDISAKDLKEKKLVEEKENGKDAATNGKENEENGEPDVDDEEDEEVDEEDEEDDGEGEEEDEEDDDDDIEGGTKRAAEDDDDDDEDDVETKKQKTDDDD